MEIKINSLEQKMLANHIEINNINNTELSASEIIKKIANKTNIALAEHDIADAYKNKKDKIFVEFTTFRKKSELMSKLNRHRIDGSEINKNDTNNNYIYINDRLTNSSKRLLWLAKNKAKQNNWKFVWVRHGVILARKEENQTIIRIECESDIEKLN